jgi:hypothetical protein
VRAVRRALSVHNSRTPYGRASSARVRMPVVSRQVCASRARRTSARGRPTASIAHRHQLPLSADVRPRSGDDCTRSVRACAPSMEAAPLSAVGCFWAFAVREHRGAGPQHPYDVSPAPEDAALAPARPRPCSSDARTRWVDVCQGASVSRPRSSVRSPRRADNCPRAPDDRQHASVGRPRSGADRLRSGDAFSCSAYDSLRVLRVRRP